MNNRFGIIGGVVLSVGMLCLVGLRNKQTQQQAAHTIGILQTVSHPALDAVREGFISQLRKQMGDAVAFVVQNAQGDMVQAQSIAQQFHARDDIDGILAIATPAAQVLHTIEKHKPIFIAAVTDPHALGLLEPNGNVCGSCDMIDVTAEVNMLHTLLPSARTVALFFNSGEINSRTLATKMRKELERVGLKAIDVCVTSPAEVPTAVLTACSRADAVLCPTDNTVASSIEVIASLTQQQATPLIVSDNLLVPSGALAAMGVDYHASGQQVANIAQRVLGGEQPAQISLGRPENKTAVINKTVCAALGVVVPDRMQAQFVEGTA